MALVLAIEPDLRQAEILKRIVHEKVKADVVIVDSRDAAMEAMRSKIPDVMLLSALLSPRDEDELVAHLRTLDNAEHLQTHTIPQLASAAGSKSSGGGLLNAFRRKKKNAEPFVSGCDPDHFADEIRVFIEQAEQKRFELAEDLKYRPAIRPSVAAAPQPRVADEAAQASTAGAGTTSWDSPFEWRKSDAIPLPPTAFEEERPLAASQQSAPAAADVDLGFDLPSFEATPSFEVAPSFEATPSFEAAPSFETAAPVESTPAVETAPAVEPAPVFETTPSFVLQALPPFEPETATWPETQPASTFEPVAAPPLDTPPQSFEPDVAGAPAADVQAMPTADADPIVAVETESFPEPSVEITFAPIALSTADVEQLNAPELFETFAPPSMPVAEIPAVEAAAVAEPEPVAIAPIAAPADSVGESMTFEATSEPPESITFDLTPVVDIPIEITAAPATIPEEIESFSVDAAVPEIEWVPDTDAADEPVWQANAPAPDPEGPQTSEAGHEEIPLDWAALEEPSALAAPAESVDIDLDSLAVSVEATEADASVAPAPKRRPPNLGPLATWARLERKSEERRPGSDMREIIERLAVPPHIAGVSYARGVRIRRVRVAGTRDRRRPADHKGPVILSRRALAATRAAGPSATA